MSWAPPTPTTPEPTVQLPPPAIVPLGIVSDDPNVATWIHESVGPNVRPFLQRFQVSGLEFEPERLAKELINEGAQVVCFGPDVRPGLVFATAEAIDAEHGHIARLAVCQPDAAMWKDAMRTGVRELIDVAAVDDEFEPAVTRSVERAIRAQNAHVAKPIAASSSRVIVVVSPKGGSGKTMFTTNLSVALASLNVGPVVLADFDVQFGDSASALGLDPTVTVAELAMVPEMDSTTVKVHLTPHPASGLYVLCGAKSPEDGDVVSDKVVGRTLDVLARDFAFVVVDTAAGLDEAALAALEQATDVVLLSSLDVSSVRGLGKEIQVLHRLGLLAKRKYFVLNRADDKIGITVGDVEQALGLTPDATIPATKAVPLSMNQGAALVLDQPNERAAQSIAAFARSIAGVPLAQRKGLLWWRKSS